MCGICGVFNTDGSPAAREPIERMRAALSHRGPDDEGLHLDGPAGLGFRRLSILDLEHGHQPMTSVDGKTTIVFNGEIYNHPKLRGDLQERGHRFRTRSDTETILELYLAHGEGAFARLEGMFAVAIWDRAKRRFWLARDPLGIKPLYYAFDGKALTFSSEVRSLLAGSLDTALDQAGVLDYLAYGKVHAPRTILRDALKLEAGHWLKLDDAGLKIEAFWRVPRTRPQATVSATPSLQSAADSLDAVLSESVRASMLSDVPVGCFLSGGVDSSLVAAYMTRHSGGKKVLTFSVGFEGAQAGIDESAFAKQAAAHLGTEHHALTLPADILSQLDRSVELLDEPIADSAILPTFLLAEHARKHVKVVLTGEGADELFAGYNRYKAAWVNERIGALPGWGRKLASMFARRMGKGAVFEQLPFEDARQWAEATASARPDDLKNVLHEEFWESSRRCDPMEWIKDFKAMERLEDALAFDLRTVLVDSLLMKVDKSTMRASLEARVPFLNRAVVEHALGLPASFKIRHFKGKYLLRKVAQRYLPEGLAWRRKHGFVVPWERWVRDPKNGVLERLLESPALKDRRVFNMDRLRLFREQLCAGSRAVEAGLFFRVAVLGLWIESLDKKKMVHP